MNKKRYPSDKWVNLLNTERRERQSVPAFFSLAQPESDDIWLDLGCGPGYYTLPLAKKVKRILAADISEEMLNVCRRLAAEQSLKNIDYIQSDGTSIQASDEFAHKALLSDMFHEVEDRKAVVHELFRLLKPGGRLFIIDWERQPMDIGPPLEHRLARQSAIAELSAAGFRLEQVSHIYLGKYILIFRK